MTVRVPNVGDVIAGKYALESVLGEGGMGVVFSARHMLTGRRFAVKVLTRAGGEAVDRVLAEAQTLARVEHPNVVSVLDVGEHEGTVFLVMELLRGQSLADIAHRRALPLEQAVAHLMPAFSGIAAVHAAGIVHRDLKPENLFVSMDVAGTGYDTKVLDFGISKITDGSVERTTLSRSGATVGTPQYMAPEQVRAAPDVDARADVYALGVILYELLSGRLPFESQSVTALAVAIVNDAPTPLEKLVPGLDATVAAVVRRAMAKSPDDRFPDVASLASALEPFAGGVRFVPPRQLPEHTGRVSLQLERIITMTPRHSQRAVTQDVVVRKRRQTDPRAEAESRPPPPPETALPEITMPPAAALPASATPRPAPVFRPRPPGAPVGATPAAAKPSHVEAPVRPPAARAEPAHEVTPARIDVTPRPVARSLDVVVIPKAVRPASRRWLWVGAPATLAAIAAAVASFVALGNHGERSPAAQSTSAVGPASATAPSPPTPIAVSRTAAAPNERTGAAQLEHAGVAQVERVALAPADQAGAAPVENAATTLDGVAAAAIVPDGGLGPTAAAVIASGGGRTRHGARHVEPDGTAPGAASQSGRVRAPSAGTATAGVVVGRSGTLSADDF